MVDAMSLFGTRRNGQWILEIGRARLISQSPNLPIFPTLSILTALALVISSAVWLLNAHGVQAQETAPTETSTPEPTVEPVETPPSSPETELFDEPTVEPTTAPTTEPTSEPTPPPTVEATPEATQPPAAPTAEPTTEAPIGPIDPIEPIGPIEPILEPISQPVNGLPVELEAEPEPGVVIEKASGNMVGNVKVEGLRDDLQAGHVVTIEDAGLTGMTDANGNFALMEVALGSYDLRADSPGFLSATCTGLGHATGLTVLNGVTLLAGDIDSSGAIDIVDATAFGLAFGNVGPGEVADFNRDGQVNALDMILMSANFDQTSAANPWRCQAGQ